MNLLVRTLPERLFDIVRERIVTGALPTDTPIRQDALAAELGVSKIPVREALARLEQEGLLASHANRGYVVPPMSAQQVEEIYDLRLAVEPAAAARAATAATDAERQMARDAFAALDEAASHDLAAVAMRNRQFHIALVRPGGRALTTQLVERLAILAERYTVAHLQPAGRESRAHLEHAGLLAAWLAGNSPEVERLLAAHIRGTGDDLKRQLGRES